MSNILLIIVSLLSGLALQRVAKIPEDFHKSLNGFIIYISLPALTLYYLPQLELDWQLLFALIMPWAVMLLGVGFFLVLGKAIQLNKPTIGALALVCGLGNISFVGFPVVEAMYQKEGLEIAIIVGQGGFLAVSIFGVLLASYFANANAGFLPIFKNVIKFPPFIAFLAGIIIAVMAWNIPQAITDVFKSLGSTLTPLAMASVGFSLKFKLDEIPWKEVTWGLLFKLIIAPAVILAAYGLLTSNGLLVKVNVIEAAMPPMVTAAIIATEYQLRPKLSNLLVGLGLIISGLTLSLWWYLLG